MNEYHKIHSIYLRDRMGRRIITKIKHRDWPAGE